MQSEFERLFVKPTSGRTLIVGSRVVKDRPDRRKLYSDVIGVDIEDGEGVDRIVNMELPLPSDLGKFSHVECCSVLEHSPRPWKIAENIQRLLVPGGSAYVAAPFVWRVHNYPGDYFRFTIDGLKSMFDSIEWQAAKYASVSLDDGPKLPLLKQDGVPFLARSMACLFGIKTDDARPVEREVFPKTLRDSMLAKLPPDASMRDVLKALNESPEAKAFLLERSAK
jgi:SAM-dependent methyltransferase